MEEHRDELSAPSGEQRAGKDAGGPGSDVGSPAAGLEAASEPQQLDEPEVEPEPTGVLKPSPADERRDRLTALLVALTCAVAIVAPRALTPDPRGYGTHEQLFLPACGLRTLTTLPCPFCGMTTSFAQMSRGDAVGAFHSHPGGPLLYAIAALGGVYCLMWAISGWHPLEGRGAFMYRARNVVLALLLLWVLALLARFT